MIDSRRFWGSALAMLATLGCTNERPPTSEGNAEGSETQSSATESGESETGEPVACTDMPGPWDAGFEIPWGEAPTGDAEQGLWALVHEDYVSCGIPYDLFVNAAQIVPSLQGETLPWRDGMAAELPYSFNLITSAGGTPLVTANCLTCHASYLNGELVIGLGVHDADYTDTVALAGFLPNLDPETDAGAELAKFKARTQALAPYIQTYTIGTNPADIMAVVLSSHRDPETLAWSDEPLVDVNPQMIPTDTPPWWRVKKKAGHFFTGMSRGDHRGSMMFASSLCVDDVATAEQMVDYFADIRAYLESIEPPAWPWAVDQELAAEGEAVFECNCSGCHGTYDSSNPDAETYPNLLLPLEVIGTDSASALAASEVDTLIDWFNSSWYGEWTQLMPEDPFPGYVAPPLDGVWATAPYLHNASVPSLALVLDSTARPTYWRRVNYSTDNYDQEELGWPYEVLDHGQDQASESERKHIYDTTIFAHGNAGHPFGDHLTDAERAAVLEYLKTI
jgi:mono/diheme cytochrome c family protein